MRDSVSIPKSEHTPQRKATKRGGHMPFVAYSMQKNARTITTYCVGSLTNEAVVQLENELDTVLEKKPHVLIINMENLDYLSTMGLRAITKAQMEIQAYDGTLTLKYVPPHIQKVFEIFKNCSSLTFYSDPEELEYYISTIQYHGKEVVY